MRDDPERSSYKAGRTTGGSLLGHGAQPSCLFPCPRHLAAVAICLTVLSGSVVMPMVAQAGPERPSFGSQRDEPSRPGVRRYGPQYEDRRYGPESDNRRYGPRSDRSSRDDGIRQPDEREPAPGSKQVLPLEPVMPPARSESSSDE